VDAKFLDQLEVLKVSGHHRQPQKFYKRVAVLRSELDSEFEVFLSYIKVVVRVRRMLSHEDTGSFAPYLT
jgi:hypothetical protein